MVKIRGIEINVISQFDICKLPEFAATATTSSSHVDPFQSTSYPDANSLPPYPTAVCSVPIYPGSQIWFEYTVDGPHPAGAVYFLKLIINDQVVTSWDCTAKHGFHGKMMYNLVSEENPIVKRQALRFGDGIGDGHGKDVVQINVYRVEKRVRIKEIEEGIGKVAIKPARPDGLRLINSGLLEPGIRPKRYKYQLLDPVDVPYAAFQFLCRSLEFFEKYSVIPLRECNSPLSASSSMVSRSSGNFQLIPTPIKAATRSHSDTDAILESSLPTAMTPTSPVRSTPPKDASEKEHGSIITASESFAQIHPNVSDDSLSVKTRDSIEDLPSNVSRSPRSPKSPKTKKDSEIPPSPTRSPGSPRRRLTKKLTISTNNTNFEGRKLRPMSPFTGGGMLRKASIPPRTAPASVTEFGPTVEEEVKAELNKDKLEMEAKAQKSALRTTAEERGGKKLIGFLARRFTGEKGVVANANDASKCMQGRDSR